YFIQGSVLTLGSRQNSTDVLDSQQVMIRDDSFVFNGDVWRGSITGGSFLGGLDIAGVVEKFLSAPGNPKAENGLNQQSVVVSNMMAFMDTYNTWAGTGFPAGGMANSLKNLLQPAVVS